MSWKGKMIKIFCLRFIEYFLASRKLRRKKRKIYEKSKIVSKNTIRWNLIVEQLVSCVLYSCLKKCTKGWKFLKINCTQGICVLILKI